MKKFVLIAVLVLGTHLVSAQAPEKMSYQAIVRNASGQLLTNQNVAVRVSVLQGSSAGTSVYSERVSGLTNANGLISLEIGSGTVLSGTFSAIDWGTNNYYLKTETDPAGGTNYTITGTSQLLSVPYALYAKSSGGGGGGSLTLPYSATANSSSPLFSLTNSGTGAGVMSSTGAGFAIHGITNSQASAGVIADNSGAGEAVVGRNTSDIAGAVVGRNDGGGYGVRGFVSGNTAGTSIGVFGQAGLNSGKGRAGRFVNSNVSNDRNAFEVESNSTGNIPDNTQGNVSSFLSNNTGSVSAAVRGEVKTIFGNFGAAGIFGVSSGTGGFGGLFYSSNTTGNGRALVALNDGNGDAIVANVGKDGDAIEANIDGAGRALYAWTPTFSTGKAAEFQNFNTANTNAVITVKTVGNGIAGDFKVDRVSGTSAAVRGEVNSQFANFGTSGIYGISSGTGGYAGIFHANNPNNNTDALLVITEGNGNALKIYSSKNGNAVDASAEGTGTAVYGSIPNFGIGKAARFVNYNTTNSNPVLTIENRANNDLLVLKANATPVNVARINAAGRGFFNGGTQSSGADVAEAFNVEGNTADYEPGDILVISTNTDRTIEKSSSPYSALVAGVYATKPGVLLTEEHIDSELIGKVPMGVIGVIPTKVCLEGGNIKRGDLLVTSSQYGVAMKGDLKKVQIGQVLGKALQDYNKEGIGKIKVLVNIK
ncbi:hypothetical protein [Chryseobacterium sp. FH1]|uniref:hypothetical protein n=1 Tax=Chryseobacterium sp. FH1 TaxID=1233951 RepID=UPI0004E3EF01|nr:hypothetical protein [Chryseobacterium sp. FH1]KFC18863.1 hypothetical protein IO90_17945 [Chryseobacterium sp. FH1]